MNACACGGRQRCLSRAGGLVGNVAQGISNRRHAGFGNQGYDDQNYGAAGGFGGLGFGGFGAGGVATQSPTPPAPARFQPVPTRPVFEPQPVFSPAAYEAAVEAPDVPMPESLPADEPASTAISYGEADGKSADGEAVASLRVVPASYTRIAAPADAEANGRSTLRIKDRAE